MSSTKHIGHQVIAMMDRLGVSPITRNYHLFYSCIANANPAMRQAVRNLGRFPTQLQLDQVIEDFCPEATDSRLLHRHEHALLSAIDDLTSRINSEQLQMNSFHGAMERMVEVLARTAEQDKVTAEILLKVVNVVGEVGKNRVASGSRALAGMDRKKDEVTALRDELLKVRRLANTDALTGLSNRRHFDEKLVSGFDKPSTFALLIADIDHFKRLNDAYGHAFGDHVLKAVAQAIRKTLREGSFLARTGGEEFAIIVPGAMGQDAMNVAERVRIAIEKMRVTNEKSPVPVTLSIGVALSTQAQNPDHLYEMADAALYRSKNSGRNRSTLCDPSEDTSSTNRYQIYAG
jgi:diguanylate cyclase